MRSQIRAPLLARFQQMKDVILVVKSKTFSAVSSILMYPRTARSTMRACDVARMNRVIDQSSQPRPGEIPGGGSYSGATDMPASGSRPLYHQSTNMPAKVTRGRNTIGFAAKNQKNFVERARLFQDVFRECTYQRSARRAWVEDCWSRTAPRILDVGGSIPLRGTVDTRERLRAQRAGRRLGENCTVAVT